MFGFETKRSHRRENERRIAEADRREASYRAWAKVNPEAAELGWRAAVAVDAMCAQWDQVGRGSRRSRSYYDY